MCWPAPFLGRDRGRGADAGGGVPAGFLEEIAVAVVSVPSAGAFLGQTERLGFDKLEGLVPDRYAEHWRQTLAFLSILTAQWPAVLAGERAIGAAERRNLLLAALAARWAEIRKVRRVVTGALEIARELAPLVRDLLTQQ